MNPRTMTSPRPTSPQDADAAMTRGLAGAADGPFEGYDPPVREPEAGVVRPVEPLGSVPGLLFNVVLPL
ncbi:MAG: hypothetical protein EHM77_08875, partial [Planctomycetaceae bacterium]